MSLVQLRDYQKLTLDRDAHAIAWWHTYRHPRGSLASAAPRVVVLRKFSRCLGGRMPKAVCWHYHHRRWTTPLYQRTLQRLASVPQIIEQVFGSNAWAAKNVALCESHFSVTASNGQYWGVFQMGRSERARFGGSSTDAWDQVRAAYRYFLRSGWGPWSCRP